MTKAETQSAPTEELVAELVRRGARKISAGHRELYKPGYRLLGQEYVHQEIVADTVLLIPPYYCKDSE